MLQNHFYFPPLERPRQKCEPGSRRRVRLGACLLVAVLAVNLAGLVLSPPAFVLRRLPHRYEDGLLSVRLGLYGAWLDLQRGWLLARLPKYYKKVEQMPFVLYFPPGEQEAALAVARVAARHLDAVARDVGVRLDEPIPLVISPNDGDLSGMIGGRHSVLGAYWRGVIWVVSPRQWLDVNSPSWEREFEVQGPVVHELVHWLLDRRTGGNVPPWFDEGFAQYEEYLRTGYEWIEPANRLDQPLYPLPALERRFDELENEALAYRQAFLAVKGMADSLGNEVLRRITLDLARGHTLEQAVLRAAGRPLEELAAAAWQEIPGGRRTASSTESERGAAKR